MGEVGLMEPGIRERSFRYAVASVRFYQSLKNVKEGSAWVIGKQFLRCATSVGANVEEAQSAESRPDFIHKLTIAQKEARESLYWLRLFEETQPHPTEHLNSLLKETQVIIAILTSIITKTKKNSLHS